MSRSFNTIIGLGLAGAVLFQTGCSSQPSVTKVAWESDGVPRQSGTFETKGRYQFAYYPDTKVYFEPHSQTYYWIEQGQWNEGPELPAHYIIHPDDAKIVELSTRVPPLKNVSGQAYTGLFNEQSETGSSSMSQSEAFLPWSGTFGAPTTTKTPSIAQVESTGSVQR